ncbi:hypothetical protein [Cryptosporangium sp. NPDC048952]|uniref:hypothetical protein n=1 Tax=Cryptosporangium sp. NPDC048952 TaxID=3363961 RepID=UPI0037191424
MTQTIGKLADRLLSAVVPRTTAAAGYETWCFSCGGTNQRCTRYCSGNCSPWYCDACGTC